MFKKLFFLCFVLIFCSSFSYSVSNLTMTSYEYVRNFGEIQSVSYVKDYKNDDRYALFLYKNGGYMLYDLLTNEDVEYSLVPNSSPYQNIEGDKYYFGLNYYGIKKNGLIYDVYTNEVIELSNFDNMTNISYSRQSNDLYKLNNENFTTSYEVDYSNYFKSLDGAINKFPLNNSDDCGYVAACILLGYYANFYDPNLSCVHYMNPVQTNTEMNKYQYVTCYTQEFKDNIFKESSDPNATIPINIFNAISRYISSSQSTYKYSIKFDTAISTIATVIGEIKNNKPTLLFGNFNASDSSQGTGNHVVVGYGVTNDLHVIAHMGHIGRTNVMIKTTNIGFIGGYVNMTPQTSNHLHGAYYKLNNQYYCLKCNEFINPINQYNYSLKNDSVHKKECLVCKTYNNETHLFTSFINGKRRCIYCDFVTNKPGEIIIQPSYVDLLVNSL